MAGSRSSSNNGLPLAKVKQWPILGGREDQISMVKRALKNRANILLHGPEGCGKTMFVHAIANETTQPFYELLGKVGSKESVKIYASQLVARALCDDEDTHSVEF
ncbi:hypothetical protein Fmac_020937 [Flemingia macrophylla]|uniref:ATPase AAA-type core domain-containing protein n=1 Tax=Flemingia macrophylla TaxID=520843 RepID=A0ABD1LVD3_9FABA